VAGKDESVIYAGSTVPRQVPAMLLIIILILPTAASTDLKPIMARMILLAQLGPQEPQALPEARDSKEQLAIKYGAAP